MLGLQSTLLFALLAASAPALAQDRCTAASPSYDAAAAWADFEQQLRLDYAYLARGGPSFEAVLARAKARALATKTPQQLADVLQPFTRIFVDPHFNVGPDCGSDYAYVPSASDLWAELRDGRYVIVDVRAGSRADALGVRPGWEVVAVGGRPAAEAALIPFGGLLDAPTPRQREYGLNIELAGRLGTPRTLTFSADGTSRALSLPDGYASVRKPAGTPHFSVRREGAVAVIRANDRLGDNAAIRAFDQAIASVADSAALILDLRDTPGGGNSSVARAIMGHFVTTERPYQVHVYPYEERRYGPVRKAVELVLPRTPHYGHPVAVLGGRWTGSVGEGLMIGMDAIGAAATVGSPLADLLGGGYVRTLGDGPVSFFLANEALFHVDGRAREDYVPEIALAAADRGADGGDPGLAAALAFLRKFETVTRP